MTDSQAQDTEIMEAVRAGDESAFLSIYRRLQAPVFRFALHVSGSKPVAEDVTQEVFLNLMHRPGRFDARKGTLASYVMGTARNCLLGRLRKERGMVPLGSAAEGSCGRPEPADAAPDPLSGVVRTETVRWVRQAVVSLPLRYREVLVLCDLDERSYQEASEILGCATGTVRSRLHRARELLVQKLRVAKTQTEPARAGSRRCPA